MEQRILLIDEVSRMFRVSTVTIRRYLHLARKGEGNFPLPISPRGGKCRWLLSDIEAYMKSQSTAGDTNLSEVGRKQRKREAKAFEQRQKEARRSLLRHAEDRQSKQTVRNTEPLT